MTNEELERHVRLLHHRLKIVEKMIDSIHDTLMYSPPVQHTAMFMDAVEDELAGMREDIDATVTGLNRVRADSPDTGRSIAEVSQRVNGLTPMQAPRPPVSTDFNPFMKLKDVADDI
jgi:hypothetical protein